MEKRAAGRVHCRGAGRTASLADRLESLPLGFPTKHFLLAVLRACRVYGRDGSANSPQQHFADYFIEYPLVHCPVDQQWETRIVDSPRHRQPDLWHGHWFGKQKVKTNLT